MGLRVDRLAQFLKEEVAEILQRQIADPRLKFVSVTRVQMSSDLRYARISVSVLGTEGARRAALSALEGARGRIQGLVAPRIRARFMPQISFTYDPGLAESVRISRLIDDAVAEDRSRQSARGEAPPPPSAPPSKGKGEEE